MVYYTIKKCSTILSIFLNTTIKLAVYNLTFFVPILHREKLFFTKPPRILLFPPTPHNQIVPPTVIRKAGVGLSVSVAAGMAAAGKWWPSARAPRKDAVCICSSTAASTGLCLASPSSSLAAQAVLGKLNFKSPFGPLSSAYPGRAGWRGRQDQEIASFQLKLR